MTKDMTPKMSFKRYTRIFYVILMLLMCGAGEVWADGITIYVEKSDGTTADITGNGGPVSGINNGSVSVAISNRVVTLTVTPNTGYYIKASDIVVEPLVNPSRSRVRRRVSGIANQIEGTLYNHETAREPENVIRSLSGPNSAYYVFTVPEQYDAAYVTVTFTAAAGEIRIPGSSITYDPNGHYILEDDVDASVLEVLYTGSNEFSGTFEGVAKADGTFPKITGATHALFSTIKGGTVKNIMLDNVTISSETNVGAINVGAICNEATGASRIYNCGVLATSSTVEKDDDGYDKITSCSSTISGSGYVGGIVGLLDGSSRVINCFSYANVSGGSEVGGIVGHNNVATTSDNLQTMVMNCMFYGEVSGSSIAPIYNGTIITNDGDANGVNNFNYFRLEASYIQDTDLTKVYNCALGAETRFLQRFEFFRNLLNSNRELAAWWATDDVTNKDDIAKWVLDKDIAPYPILKKQGKYPSIVNYDPERTYDAESGKMVSRSLYSEANRNKGGTIGSLNVSISNVGSNAPSGARLVKYSLRLVRTDKDDDDYNFNYDKVQLPYYNDVGIGNYTGNKVVTGWKITSITGGTQGSYSTGADVTYDGNGNLTATPYNFADRKCTDKDLYSVSGRVFNQGAYWDVPEGVTAITIEPYWGKAVYLADAYWDVTYKSAMATAVNVANVGGSQHYTGGSSTFNGQTIYTDIGSAIADEVLYESIGEVAYSARSVYDYAVVLVGNYHHTGTIAAGGKPYTVTSVDLDGDNEPDYSLMLRFNGRTGFHPVRYDFLNLIGLGMAQKTTGGTGSYNLGIMQPKYWFEVTNTALFRVTQFEYSPSGRAKKPIILQGGVIEQWVTQQDNAGDKVSYFHVGGNVWFKEFHRGSHQDNTGKSTPHPPVSVTGGDFNKFYLTGLYQSQAAIYDDNAECYISGGRFGEVAGAGMEGIGTSNGKGNVTWIIDHADIKEFYGGGINYDKPVHGNIHTIIKNSHVTQFCGGPKFGDMEDGRTVKTVADNCTFGTFFGAGYGGNSYNRYAPRNHNNILNFPHNDSQAGNHSSWNNWLQAYYKQDYSSTYKGVSTQFDYQFLPYSGNLDNVARIFVEYVAFSLATTHNVTSDLTGCIITGNYYGGGSLGKVDGDVTSTLTNCSVEGNVFGAGFSGSIPTVEVMNTEFITEPYYYTDLGTYRTAVLPSSTTEPKTTTTYHWQQATATEFSSKQIDKGNKILYTTEDLTTLGTVTGKVTLNIEGNTLVKGNVTENNATTQSGGVFGGGDASAALGDTEVNIEATGLKEGYTYNAYNVFGGGNKADVSGSVVVNMKNGIVNNDVYGGGALANTNIGNATAYGTENESISSTATKTTTVNLQGGTINGDAYGGGLGRRAATGVEAVEAKVYGDITVNLGAEDASVAATAFNISYDNAGTEQAPIQVVKSGRVFGTNNLNGSPKGDVTVNVYKTVAGNSSSRTAVAAYKKKEGDDGYVAPTYEVAAVYGGGNLANYTTTGKKAKVNIKTCNVSVESVYGGGNAAAVPATEVTVDGAYEIQYVFGGGNGKDKYTLDGGSTWIENAGANVDGNANTLLTGGFIHEAYGASNEKGIISGTATLQADDAGDTDCALDVWKMVGAGKNADIIGDVNLVLGCMPEAKVNKLFGGADNANVFGNVTLTITSGNFGEVFGGNNLTGIITGNIILNVEETGCRPINIDALYLGGNQAAYSKYGYYVETSNEGGTGLPSETAVLTKGKLTLLPRESADDNHKPVRSIDGTTWTVYAGGTTEPYPVYAEPILNVRSFTHIGEVFGGGLGEGATMYANPTVNINQTYGIKSDGAGGYTAKATELGTIGNVYGGGNAAAIEGITTVNIGTEQTVDFITEPKLLGTKGASLETTGVAYIQNENGTFKTKVQGANITENVFGGGKLADVRDITNVNICAKDNGSEYEAVPEGDVGVTIGGNVFGGGKGEAEETGTRAFYCEKAMVGVNDLNSTENNNSSTYANHGTHVRIGHGTVNGTVYGGGEIGRVEFHTEVTIGYGGGTGSPTKSPVINGYVYGAGKGAVTHGYSGLVRGDSKLTIQGDAKVGQSVYGGGEKASVGKYEVVGGLPKTPMWGGKCIVTIQGYAEIGPNDMQMVTASGKPDDTGHVFGGGAGILPYENVTGDPYSIQPSGKVTYNSSYEPGDDHLDYEAAYLKFIRSLGLASNTEVTIGEHAFVKGSVYGGSENGYVQANTHVTVAGGQVGNGDGVNRPYTDEEWAAEKTEVLKECAHWPYQSPYAPYDIYKDSNNDGKPDAATDGHTFYGNVFGGGRGYYPYTPGPDLTTDQIALGYSKGLWLRAAGSVGGNTVVDITDGHILTSVYGGNEMTDVTGSCTINMRAGTVGVPRTKEQIQAHPVTCNVFGAGKGDQRVNFNQQTNVASTQVNISGTARVYGSIFGGGEDGHVLGDAETNIGGSITIGNTAYPYSGVLIGSTGISGSDGNVFGGGRGFSETALTAGVIGGNVRVNIHNGKMLGSVFGGGRLASVGTYFASALDTDHYGKMQEDDNTSSHGHIYITIDGGTIGATANDGTLAESDFSIGDVFGGCKGSSNNNLRFGVAKTTSITMSGGKVNGSVYGGGEIATVGSTYGGDVSGEGNTTIVISGGEVGDGVTKKGGAKIGNVYGGGKGSLTAVSAGLVKGNTRITISETDKTNHPTIIYHNVYGGGAYGSVGAIHRSNEGADYVPGRASNVLNMPTSWTRKVGNTGTDTGTAEIYITGGQIGTDGDENGMVYGSSRGDVATPTGANSDSPFGTDVDGNDRTAWVYETKVVIGTLGSTGPDIRGSVYGSGENGHVFDEADVIIHSGKVGIDANTPTYGNQSITDPTTNTEYTGADYPKRGNIYGGGCGEDYYTISGVKYYNPLAGIVLGGTKVTIDGGKVVHNVYGGGALGSVGTSNYNTGGKATIEISGGQIGDDGTDDGNVYGASRGNLNVTQAHIANVRETEVKIMPNDTPANSPVIWNDVYGGGEAGIVTGSVAVNVSGGEVKDNVYGGGALADTNTGNVADYGTNSATIFSTSTYTTTVNLTGGLIGNAYGGGLGHLDKAEIPAQEATYYTAQEAAAYNAALPGAVTTSDTNPNTNTNYTEEEAATYNAALSGAVAANSVKTSAVAYVAPEGIPAFVYGDVIVNVNKADGTGTAIFRITKEDTNSDVYKSGRVFGCNNMLGTPKGDVTVNVYSTTPDNDTHHQGDNAGEHIRDKSAYEIQGVYGGGNRAEYIPVTGKKTTVNIHGCDRTSIQYVFGGGNAARVPETHVNIYGCFEIETVFGGGNGSEPVWDYGYTDNWIPSPGANVTDIANVSLKGGYIHSAFAGSFVKGTCGGTHLDDTGGTGECMLQVTDVYGGGKDADVDGGIELIISGCTYGNLVTNVYAGSYNARILGGVTLNITGGTFTNVFGGNNYGGLINGPIVVNIEETDECKPVIISNLYGGNNQADYPGAIETLSNPSTNLNITVNVKSATHIGNVYGGCLQSNVHGNTTVNINMMKGNWADKNVNFPVTFDRSLMPNVTNTQQTYVEVENIQEGSSVTGLYKKVGNDYVEQGQNVTAEENVTYYQLMMSGHVNDEIGTIGNVYGGGYMGYVSGNSTVNIGTATTVDIMRRATADGIDPKSGLELKKGTILATDGGSIYGTDGKMRPNVEIATDSKTVLGAHITGNVYGGGDQASVTGNTYVNICATKGEASNDAQGNPIDYTYALVDLQTSASNDYEGVTIGGCVYGGGKGLADNYECDKGMVGTANNNGAGGTGRTFVYIGNGSVGGSVYGGGEVGRVEANTRVTIGNGDGDPTNPTSAPVITGSVYGAGQGVATHGYSGLVRGNSAVTIQGNAEVEGSVYGGGQKASVGAFWVKNINDGTGSGAPADLHDVPTGMPYARKSGGKCTVTIQGYATIGPDNMQMPTFSGHVFGAGKGVSPYVDTDTKSGSGEGQGPGRWYAPGGVYTWESYANANDAYLRYLQTLALADETDVTIKGHAFIKGSVYGGSENGRVLDDTHVKIQEFCQIGVGAGEVDDNGKSKPYAEAQFINPSGKTESEINTAVLAECNSWPYTAPYAPYDPNAHDDGYYYNGATKGNYAEGGMPAASASDGHTFYGNVFGGGSGYFPYQDPTTGESKWHWEAGAVGGNTLVDITGGHILTNVYGGNEMTNVGKVTSDGTFTGGRCTVNFGGKATLGVPRTLDQILAHPVCGYLFGAGKGDPRYFFNQQTNVNNVVVNVTGGIIYGSVLGGGEDGHVMGNVTMTIGVAAKPAEGTEGQEGYKPAVAASGPTIGTWGTSYVDGNVFGGGRGFTGNAMTAGAVCGNVALTINDGTMLGSVYGGGRMGPVGLYLAPTTDTDHYGVLIPDGVQQVVNGNNGAVTTANVANLTHGRVDITISGGIIGNDHEYVYNPETSVITGSLRNTEFEDYIIDANHTEKRLKHTKGGNVFAGSMGRLYALDGVTPLSHWAALGQVKSTKLTINGGTIKSNVYGGGELAKVAGYRTIKDSQNEDMNASTEIIINKTGSNDIVIGTEVKDGGNAVKYTFGSVFGGGYGSTVETLVNEDQTTEQEVLRPKTHAGIVEYDTKITMQNGTVLASVYGGGEMAGIAGSTDVTVSGGTIGKNKTDDTYYGGASMGNVYGGGKGDKVIVRSGLIHKNTRVTISGSPTIYHNVYGGGAYGSVGTFTYTKQYDSTLKTWKVAGISGCAANTGTATISITGGTIGVDGHNNGMVFGSSRGDVGAPESNDDLLAWVNDANVEINGSSVQIKGSVYGGGENGHVFRDTDVQVKNGTIGIEGEADDYRGNVYGAGCGTDKYYSDASKEIYDGNGDKYNPLAGIVQGSTNVTISGGTVVRSVYGGGAMGSVGNITNKLEEKDESGKYKYKHIYSETTSGTEDENLANATTFYGFGLSWPYEFMYGTYTVSENNNTVTKTSGLAKVTIEGGATIGVNVYGAARGGVEVGEDDISKHRYEEAKLANVRETQVIIGTASGTQPTINGSVYGGGEDGHVYENTSVIINDGTIAHSVFGGGKGTSQFKTTLLSRTTHQPKQDKEDVYSWTAGRVYGNTEVTVNGGSVSWFIYGGGNYGSVGKGNYSGGADDYFAPGYGELPSANGNLWTPSDGFKPDEPITDSNKPTTMADYFLCSGKSTVNLFGGTVGATNAGVEQNSGIPYGSVFGGSRGKSAMDVGQLSPRYKYLPDFFLGYVNNTFINFGGTSEDGAVSTNGPTIYGSLYGGGQDGHVRNSAEIRIFKGSIESQNTEADQGRSGNVFGAGSGIGTFHDSSDGKDKCSYASGSVTCRTLVEVNGGTIDRCVYGGGAMASVGPPKIGADEQKEVTASSTKKSCSHSLVDIKGGIINGSVFGGSRGPSDNFLASAFTDKEIPYDPTKFSTDIWADVIVSGGKISGSVYGGGETGYVKCDVNVNILDGEIETDVYGGGARAHTNTGNLNQNNTWTWTDNDANSSTYRTAKYTTTVNLLGGTIDGDVYGGGLGRREYGTPNISGYESDAPAFVYGDVKVNLNGLESGDYDASIHGATTGNGARLVSTDDGYYQIKDVLKGAIVKRVFGCNNLNGSPQGKVRVHVFATQHEDAEQIINTETVTNAKVYGSYDVDAVYGGGNLAAYKPMGPGAVPGTDTDFNNLTADYQNTTQRTEVIIDGCDRTSIKQVYGGSNAAPAPATYLEVNGTYEIDEVFGGGNGDDKYSLKEGSNTVWYENPGANVGYGNYATYPKEGQGDGSVGNPYKAVDNPNYDTKEERLEHANEIRYGSGIATTEIKGGKIHTVYGGSNKRGNISTTALSIYESMYDDCPIDVDNSYGGSKDAEIDAAIDMRLQCAKGVKEMFGGSMNSDVNSDINLTITNGSSLERVFGGNNTSGAINGSITVNIEEGGCEPIHIVDLYVGGYLAPYSVYGYEKNEDGTYKTEQVPYLDENDVTKYQEQRIPLTSGNNPKHDPVINVISATRIDNIYGGGYQAKIVGNSHVNVNMTNGKVEVENKGTDQSPSWQDVNGVTYTTDNTVTETDILKHTSGITSVTLGEAPHQRTKHYATLPIGTIGNIYGGGNLANIEGDTYVEIGTGKWLTWDENGTPIYETITTSGAKYTSKIDSGDEAKYYTQAECDTHNATLDRYIGSGVKLTAQQASAVNTALGTSYAAGETISPEFAAAYNATLPGFRTTATVKTQAVYYSSSEIAAAQEGDDAYGKTTSDIKTPAVYYTQTECNVYNYSTNPVNVAGIIPSTTELTANQVPFVNHTLGTNYQVGDKIYTEDAAIYNSSLEGFITTADMKQSAVWTWYDANKDEVDDLTQLTPARNAATITGSVYGGGKGKADNFQCDKAMVNGANGTSVIIGNGTIGTIENGKLKAGTGNVYGGGEMARVENNTVVTIGLATTEGTSAPDIKGSVFGAGQGIYTHGYSGLVRGNSTVTVQNHAKVGKSVYGGGEMASVGKYSLNAAGMPVSLVSDRRGICKVTVKDYAEIGPDNMLMTAEGGPDDIGYVFGAGKGVLPYKDVDYNDIDDDPKRMKPDNSWEIYTDNDVYLKYIETLALTTRTEVIVGGHAFIKGSVYGGSENGIVQHDTHVTIQDDCQIGNGYVQMADDGTLLANPVAVNRRYTAKEWEKGRLFVEGDTEVDASDETEAALRKAVGSNYTSSLPECASWLYQAPFAPYDIYDLDANNKPKHATDGHTFYGNVFGGGSGLFPYKHNSAWHRDATRSAKEGRSVDANGYSDGLWHEAAGAVYGNTLVEITGGHILTSVYGGNEMTNVGNKDDVATGISTVKMSGGTLGVPRTLKQIDAHPVTCYLFGAGKGDTRINFNTQTNVNNVLVEITDDARIYGSIFGGGEDGHVLNDVKLDVKTGKDVLVGKDTYRYPYIGTTGTSYVDGNLFGAGRGFSGEALTAGSVGGNVEVNISDGTMLGSVYGGGRLASVGIGFNNVNDSQYGQFLDGDNHGQVTVNISGGIIGNDLETMSVEHTTGGNVFGGSMGRLKSLDGVSYLPLWPQLGQVKNTTVNIWQADDHVPTVIKGNVYGGGELGFVRDNTTIVVGKENMASETISKPTLYRDIFGGGYGNKDNQSTSKGYVKSKDSDNNTHIYMYTPMKRAGMVGKGTNINIYGGWVKRHVYGGGEMASVGIINYEVGVENDEPTDKYLYITEHDDVEKNFALSWPYETQYVPGYDGATHIHIFGGRLGDETIETDNGDIYGGSKGLVGDRYEMAFCGNVGSTEITINYPSNNQATPANYNDKADGKYTYDCVAGAVYGGGENGHVMGDTDVKLINGLVGHSLYGGGSGKGKYDVPLSDWRYDSNGQVETLNSTHLATTYSITAGKVYGNTNVTMSGGYVVRNVYGGGTLGSVGKGNYTGGANDYSKAGFGETIITDLWNTEGGNVVTTSWQTPEGSGGNANFLGSGIATVTITGGTVGYINPSDISKSTKDLLPYGNVFGGCRGEVAPNVPISLSPRYQYCPEFFMGYVNESRVTIGRSRADFTGANAEADYAAYKGPVILGSVYGGGQDGHVRRDTHVKILKGKIGIPYSPSNIDVLKAAIRGSDNTITEAAAEAQASDVNYIQWLSRGNVYGAGSGIGTYTDESGTHNSTSSGSVTGHTLVEIEGGTIYRNVYGGGSLSSIGPPPVKEKTTAPYDNPYLYSSNHVIIKSKIGDKDSFDAGYGGHVFGASRGEISLGSSFATSQQTQVDILDGANILGNVFGGGDNGAVKGDAAVFIGEKKVEP